MMISFWHSCVVLSCLVIPCLFAKPFNLNEAIAAEERLKALHTTTRPKFGTRLFAKTLDLNEDVTAEESQKVVHTTTRPKLETSERFSLNKLLRASPIKNKKLNLTEKSDRFSLSKLFNKTNSGKFKTLTGTENTFPLGKKISSLQNRKRFQIKSPLKPRKLKTFERARHRRRNQSIKREIIDDEDFTKKYIPLLKSLSLLFDNILSESDDSFEIRIGDIGKYRHRKRNNTGCSCSIKSDKIAGTEPAKEAAVSTTTFIPISTDQLTQSTTTPTPSTTTDSTPNSDVSDLGQNTDVPTVLPRNTPSPRRDNNGYGERSSAALHASLEGNISGDFRDSERDTGSGEHKPDTKVYEDYPNSITREHASSAEFRRGLRGDSSNIRRPVYRRGLEETVVVTERQTNDDIGKDRRNINEFQGQFDPERKDGLRHFGGDVAESARENQHETRGDQTESTTPVQQFVRGDRRFLSEENIVNSELVQPSEEIEEGVFGIKHYIASNQRLIDRDGQSTAEDQKTGPTNAALISIKDLNNPIIMLQNSRKHKAPFVTIIDGYSVARDKNGANKLAEQSIRFHS